MLDPLAFAQTLRLEGSHRLARLGLVPGDRAAAPGGGDRGAARRSLLVLGVRYRAVLVATGLLVAFFLFLTGRAYWRDVNGIVAGDPASCGCFGNLLDRSPAEAFLQDVVLLVPGLLLAALAVPQRHTLGRRAAARLADHRGGGHVRLVRAEPADRRPGDPARRRAGRCRRCAPASSRSGSVFRPSFPSSGTAATSWC